MAKILSLEPVIWVLIPQMLYEEPYFYISGSSGAGLVSIYCQSWRIYDNTREDYALKWCEIKYQETYYRFNEVHPDFTGSISFPTRKLLYEIPSNGVLASKTGLLCCLREQEQMMIKISRSSNSKLLKMEEFFPESFCLNLKDERNAFFERCKEEQIWIWKSSCSHQGRGIFLLRSPAAVNTLQANTEEYLLSNRVPYKAPQARIVRRYTNQPLLLVKKFDVRSYLLIACTAPYMLFFARGYIRLTCDNYEATSGDLTVHLTNRHTQKNSLYSQLKDETVWRMEDFSSYVNEKFRKNNGLPKDFFTVFTVSVSKYMVLEVFNKRPKGQSVLPLETCHFVLLCHEDAADHHQKPPEAHNQTISVGAPATSVTALPKTWSNSEGQSDASLQPRDPAILAETEDRQELVIMVTIKTSPPVPEATDKINTVRLPLPWFRRVREGTDICATFVMDSHLFQCTSPFIRLYTHE
ncbi:LOW QUALITY PROTEIN: inactive polyglycylase TTLL10 [Rhynochetos jubatus]